MDFGFRIHDAMFSGPLKSECKPHHTRLSAVPRIEGMFALGIVEDLHRQALALEAVNALLAGEVVHACLVQYRCVVLQASSLGGHRVQLFLQ